MSSRVSCRFRLRSVQGTGYFMNRQSRVLSSKSQSPRAVPPGAESSSASRSAQANLPIAERIRGILATRSLTLSDVSRRTRELFPDNPRYHAPHNFYFQLSSAGLSPTLHQLMAISQISGYRLADWLAVFGFHLDDIPRLQIALTRERTALLDTRVYDANGKIPWFRELPQEVTLPAVAPLSSLLETAGARRLSSLLTPHRNRFLYGKIGRQDAFAFPELVPGSIVRADSQSVERLLPRSNGAITRNFFLVEHGNGVCCCRLHLAGRKRITLTAAQLPFAQVELQLGAEARILGALDLEFRPLRSQKQHGRSSCALPEVPPDLAKLWKPSPLKARDGERPSRFLRKARLRAGLSFRDASKLSREVAKALGDQRYFTSPGTFSDYEADDTSPRHIHKLFTLCILYSIPFVDLMKSIGLTLNENTLDSIPEVWMMHGVAMDSASASTATTELLAPAANGFLASLVDRFLEIPFFLRNSLDSLSGMAEVSLRDMFWVGGQKQALHPSLAGALFVVVNHRRQRPVGFRRKGLWQQPLYLLRKRDGSYLAASCSLEHGTLVVHPYAEGFVRPELLRDGVDAEVVGQIATIVRSLLPSP